MGFCGCSCSRRVLIISFALSGAVLLVTGLVFVGGHVFSKIIKNKVNQDVQLKPGSLVYKEWVKTTVPFYKKFYVFNLTNPEEVMAGTAIPAVEQKGPYSYREFRSNKVLNWTSDYSIVTHMPNRTYVFDPETSCAGCDDKNDTFVNVNIPLLTMALWLRNTNYSFRNPGFCVIAIISAAAQFNMKLFQRKSVYDILWGYHDEFLEWLVNVTSLIPTCPGREGMTDFIQLQYNNTYYGISAVNTGRTDISKLEQFTMWRGESHLSWWSDKYANMINGTDGTQFSPDVTKDDTFHVFDPEVCRSVYLTYEKDVTLKDIKLYRFTVPDKLYKSGDKGFCVPPGCLPTGLLNISLCQPLNPPIVLSPPNFYQSNKSLLETVHGLHPEKSKHETYLDVEPITGIVMRAAKRIQINVALESVDILPQTTGNFKKVFLPFIFVSESAEITDKKASEFRHKVYLAITLTKVLEYGLIALGAFFIGVVFVLLFVAPGEKSAGKDERNESKDEKKTLLDSKL